MLIWILFFVLSFLTYSLITLFGQLTGGTASTVLEAALRLFKPLPFIVLIAANLCFATALYFGFKVSVFAVPIAIAIGVIASFVYSLVFLGGALTILKVIGVLAILAGIFLLR